MDFCVMPPACSSICYPQVWFLWGESSRLLFLAYFGQLKDAKLTGTKLECCRKQRIGLFEPGTKLECCRL